MLESRTSDQKGILSYPYDARMRGGVSYPEHKVLLAELIATIRKLLEKPKCVSAGMAALGKTVELCCEEVTLPQIPSVRHSCQLTLSP